MTSVIESLDEISHRYRAVFCDLWGCLHDGCRPFDPAVRALRAFRDGGGFVLLLTNAPRPRSSVIGQLEAVGVPNDIYQEISSSGDSARQTLASGRFGSAVYHIGPDRDRTFFIPEETDDFGGLDRITRVPPDRAEGIVCTGLFDDESETPEDYFDCLAEAQRKNLAMLCANPDVVVDRGSRRVYCAGALAALYADLGGEVCLSGKPHAPIYALARERLNRATGEEVPDSAILCIGDGISTDIRGAVAENLDSLFVTGGLARHETATVRNPDPERLGSFLESAGIAPTAAIGYLR